MSEREAVARPLWPTLHEPEPGRDCYCFRTRIQQEVRDHGYSRAWFVNDEITSLQRRDGSYMKALDNFQQHLHTTEAFYSMLEECFSRQCFRPTAYHDPVYAVVDMPRLKWSVNAMFAPQFAGGWNHAITTGVFHGAHMIYDIQSAYLSALAEGLPDPATFRAAGDSIGPNGLFVIDHRPNRDLPYPFDTFTRVNATADEIEIYGLRDVRLVDGVRWWSDWPGAAQLRDEICKLSFWKQAGRMYWGRWAMTERVKMVGGNTNSITPLPSIFTNMIWAHLILSRIRMRLWHEVLRGDVRHVFTDSIICRRPRRIEPRTIGGWKLVKVYDKGVYIKGPGQYGEMFGEYLDKQAGVPLAKRKPVALDSQSTQWRQYRMAEILKLVHPRAHLRGPEVAAIYRKHGITEDDHDKAVEAVERIARDPSYSPNLAELMRVGNAIQAVMMELQEKGLAGEPAPIRPAKI